MNINLPEPMKYHTKSIALVIILILMAACGEADKHTTESSEYIKVFVGARIIDGTGRNPIEDGVLIIQAGRIRQVGLRGAIEIPGGAEIIDLNSMTLMPGIINTHGHVGNTLGSESGHYSKENILDHLSLYADMESPLLLAWGEMEKKQQSCVTGRIQPLLTGPGYTLLGSCYRRQPGRSYKCCK